MLYVRTFLPRNEWIISNVVSVVVFPDKHGLANIMYYLSIGYLMNSRPMNYNPWSYMIYVGQGYLVKHIVSTNLAIVIAHLSLYSSI